MKIAATLNGRAASIYEFEAWTPVKKNVALASTGVATEGMPVGDMTFGEPSSLLRTPAISAPLLESQGLPLGIQVMGYLHAAHDVVAIAHWMIHAIQRGED